MSGGNGEHGDEEGLKSIPPHGGLFFHLFVGVVAEIQGAWPLKLPEILRQILLYHREGICQFAVSTMELLGYFAIFLMGMTLGINGAGGSILTVPILVYLFAINPTSATAYSLVLVGSTAAIGGGRNALRGKISFEAFLTFGLPSILSVYLTRRFLLSAVPEDIGTIANYQLTRDGIIMLVFSSLMLATAFLMIRGKSPKPRSQEAIASGLSPLRIIAALEGMAVGVITGFVGAGGGFLIVPVMIWLLAIPIHEAIATSLVIIAAKSLIGFLGDLQNAQVIDWALLGSLLVLSSVGILIGQHYRGRIPARHLQQGFGFFVLVTGVLIILREMTG